MTRSKSRAAGVVAALCATLVPVGPAAAASCTSTILQSPRTGSEEVQAKALNDKGDVAGFADGDDGAFHAILWAGGDAARATDLGVLPGYVSSEAYAVNDDGVVFGVLYDAKERTFP